MNFTTHMYPGLQCSYIVGIKPLHHNYTYMYIHRCFPGGTVVKNPPASSGETGDVGLIPGSERSSEEGNGYTLKYSCLENSMDREA